MEIERKFLVNGDYKSLATKKFIIIQAYISSVPGRTVRVRLKGDKGYITIKGVQNKSGVSRFEWEKEISVSEAKKLLELCEEGIIEKTRYIVPEKSGLFFEVDEFYGDNEGLVLAEIELQSEDQKFSKPDWLGEEVSGDTRFYNSMLMKNPFKKW